MIRRYLETLGMMFVVIALMLLAMGLLAGIFGLLVLAGNTLGPVAGAAVWLLAICVFTAGFVTWKEERR